MLIRKIFCPDCGVSRSAAQAGAAGQLYECPACRVLFFPSADDIRWVEVNDHPVQKRTKEVDFADADNHRPRARSVRRYYRVNVLGVLLGVFVSTGILLTAATFVFILATTGPSSRPRETPPVNAPPAEPSAAVPTPAAPPSEENPTATAATLKSQPWLGDWDVDDEMLAGVGPGGVYAMTLKADGMLSLRCRSGLETQTAEGRWQLIAGEADARLTLVSSDAVGAPRSVECTFQCEGADKLKVTPAGGAAVAFRRRP